MSKCPDGRYRARYRDAGGLAHAQQWVRKVDAQQWIDSAAASQIRGD